MALITLPLFLASCGEKKQKPEDIIVPKPVAKKTPSVPVAMDEVSGTTEVDWIGKEYTVVITRFPDRESATVQDESGAKYYNNKVELKVVRPDGTVFFNRVFAKSDFVQQAGEDYLSKSILLGFVFDKAEGDDLYFGSSVGAPDPLSDEYVPLLIKLSRMGDVSIQKDTRIFEE